jgi:hypothetical protein
MYASLMTLVIGGTPAELTNSAAKHNEPSTVDVQGGRKLRWITATRATSSKEEVSRARPRARRPGAGFLHAGVGSGAGAPNKFDPKAIGTPATVSLLSTWKKSRPKALSEKAEVAATVWEAE